jgi:hypothetical protein
MTKRFKPGICVFSKTYGSGIPYLTEFLSGIYGNEWESILHEFAAVLFIKNPC